MPKVNSISIYRRIFVIDFMIRLSAFLLFGLPFLLPGQSISSTNLSYWYEAQADGAFKMMPVNRGDSCIVYYKYDSSNYSLRWERRESFSQRNGEELSMRDLSWSPNRIAFAKPDKPWLLLAALTHKTNADTRFYFKQIEASFPVESSIAAGGAMQLKSYFARNLPIKIYDASPTAKVFLYKESFAAASAPFAEKEGRADPVLTADSSFTVASGSEVRLSTEGLYLVQSDTNAPKGTAFMVVDQTFPRFDKIDDLSAALIYVSTRDEYEKLIDAGTDKVKFDKVILDITRDKERARNMIRKYFRRVELANIFFTSFKEGWKTDRGMIYIIYGPPDEVTRSANNEIWSYRKTKSRFIFTRAASIYDPDNFVLQRDKRLMESWYYTIDMWRKNQITSVDQN